MSLKEITVEEKFFAEIVELRKRLDLIIGDYQATVAGRDGDRRRGAAKVIDPRTGKEFKSKSKGGGKRRSKKATPVDEVDRRQRLENEYRVN